MKITKISGIVSNNAKKAAENIKKTADKIVKNPVGKKTKIVTAGLALVSAGVITAGITTAAHRQVQDNSYVLNQPKDDLGDPAKIYMNEDGKTIVSFDSGLNYALRYNPDGLGPDDVEELEPDYKQLKKYEESKRKYEEIDEGSCCTAARNGIEPIVVKDKDGNGEPVIISSHTIMSALEQKNVLD